MGSIRDVVNYYNYFRVDKKRKMKEKILLWLCDYSYRIISYIFWLYFLVIIILNFLDIEINKIMTYIFWLLLGCYLGYSLALHVVNYLDKNRNI